MEAINTNTIIGLQDQYVAAVSKVSQSNRNYYTAVTRATRKLRAGLADIGIEGEAAEQAIVDAHDMSMLLRECKSCGADSAVECICDGLNFADKQCTCFSEVR